MAVNEWSSDEINEPKKMIEQMNNEQTNTRTREWIKYSYLTMTVSESASVVSRSQNTLKHSFLQTLTNLAGVSNLSGVV